MDIRVDEHEQPFVVEVNREVSPEAGFSQAVRRAGLSCAEMILRIADMVAC